MENRSAFVVQLIVMIAIIRCDWRDRIDRIEGKKMTRPGEYSLTYAEGKERFAQERQRAVWEVAGARLRGRPGQLMPYRELLHSLPWHTEHERGVQEVPLCKITGSLGRAQQFTTHLRPRRDELRERWSRVYAAALGDVGLPPITLYQYGDDYYLRDGHHRASVAQALGAQEIQAYVTEVIGPKLANGNSANGRSALASHTLPC